MKKLAFILVLALGAGGFYIYKNPDLRKQLEAKANDLIAQSNWHKLDNYEKQLAKAKITESSEREGYVGNFSESFTIVTYKDDKGSELHLAISEDEVQIIQGVFKENSESAVVNFVSKEWKRFSGKEADFTGATAEGENADCTSTVDKGMVTVTLARNELEKAKALDELPEETQENIAKFKEVLKKKLAMEKEFQALDDELHFCFDKARFSELENSISTLKKDAEALKESAHLLIAEIPQIQIKIIREELEGKEE